MNSGSVFSYASKVPRCKMIYLQGYGDWDACVDSLTELLVNDISNSDCYALKCFLGLVRAPSLSLSSAELYGFSEYWYSLEDVLGLGGAYNYTKLSSRARDFCRLKWSAIQACIFPFTQNVQSLTIHSVSPGCITGTVSPKNLSKSRR